MSDETPNQDQEGGAEQTADSQTDTASLLNSNVKPEENAQAEETPSVDSASLLGNDDPPKTQADEVPESYADFELPEGFELNEDQLGAFTQAAKDSGMTQAEAQKAVRLQAALAKRQNDSYVAEVKRLQEETLKIPNAKDVIEQAKVGMKTIAGDDNSVLEALTKTWLGSHPGVIKALAQIGKLSKESTVADGGSNRQAQPKPFYPNMPKYN